VGALLAARIAYTNVGPSPVSRTHNTLMQKLKRIVLILATAALAIYVPLSAGYFALAVFRVNTMRVQSHWLEESLKRGDPLGTVKIGEHLVAELREKAAHYTMETDYIGDSHLKFHYLLRFSDGSSYECRISDELGQWFLRCSLQPFLYGVQKLGDARTEEEMDWFPPDWMSHKEPATP